MTPTGRTTARYQRWDIPFTDAQARAFIDSLGAANPDTPGEWFQFALVEAATGTHVGDVAAGVDIHEPRLATIGAVLRQGVTLGLTEGELLLAGDELGHRYLADVAQTVHWFDEVITGVQVAVVL